MIINLEEIKKLLPHRDPFLYLDKCEILELGVKGIGYRKYSHNEYFFKGHFPDMPIVPGVILIETLAQTAGVTVSKSFEDHSDKSVLFMSVSKAKFRKPVFPDDEIIFEVNLLNKVKTVYKFSGLAYRDTTKVCEAEFSAMINSKQNKEIF